MLILLIAIAVVVYAVLGGTLLIFLRNYYKMFLSMFSFGGTMARKDFWRTSLIFLLTLPFIMYIVVMMTEYIPILNGSVTIVVSILLIFPWAAAICRRLNDVGIPGIVRYLLTIPLAVFLFLALVRTALMGYGYCFDEKTSLLSSQLYKITNMPAVLLGMAAPFLFIISLVLAALPNRKKQ